MISHTIVILLIYVEVKVGSTPWPASVNSVFRGTRLSLQPELQSNLASAVQLALENCQEQFRWDRWNCPETAFSRNRGPTTQTTKEFAYVLSITSAAIVYVTTRNCSRGNIPGCGCNPHIIEGNDSVCDLRRTILTLQISRTTISRQRRDKTDRHNDGGAEEECEEDSDPVKAYGYLAQQNQLHLERLLQSDRASPGREVQVVPDMIRLKMILFCGDYDKVYSVRTDVMGQTVFSEGESNWVWGGCSDYVDYGEEASKKYLDETEIGKDALTYTNLHNYGVGREVVKKSLRKRCKCHGMSGSCTVKSCWMQMASLRDAAFQLKKRYERALRVDFEEGDGKVVVGNSVTANTLSELPKADSDNLIYLQESPNYCLANNTTGWRGTLGRSCSRENGDETSTSERKSCRHLCRKCGHTVKKTKRTVIRHCNCIFKWCCEVKCDACTEVVVEHFCAKSQ